MPEMTQVTESHIELDGRGRAWIKGENTKVIEVVLDRVAYGWDADEMHRQHPHLPLAKIHAALAYYYDHREELDAEIQRDLREVDAARAAAGVSPLAERWRAAARRQP
jgi:uncharacterized protein (DUF433 family)